MQKIDNDEFLRRLYGVVKKLTVISNTQGQRFKKEWYQYLGQVNPKPHLIRTIEVNKEKFFNDINYRISVLNDIRLAFEDTFHSIKSLLHTLYHIYFNDSSLFKKDFSEEDQNILKYLVAVKILGDLVQYNKMDHETVPLKYNILARNYTMLKLTEQKTMDILERMKKVNIKLTKSEVETLLDEIIQDGFIIKKKKNNLNYYSLAKELELSDEGKIKYNQSLRSIIEWPTGIWRSLFNVRELNLTIADDKKRADILNKILSKAAIQGYAASHYVFSNLIKYYESLKK